jgi:hypothetical protein
VRIRGLSTEGEERVCSVASIACLNHETVDITRSVPRERQSKNITTHSISGSVSGLEMMVS